MGAPLDALGLETACGMADTVLVIDDHLRESIGLAQREGWTVLAYLLGMAREQLHDDFKHDGGTVASPAGEPGSPCLFDQGPARMTSAR